MNIISQLGAMAQAESTVSFAEAEEVYVDQLITEVVTQNAPLANAKRQKLICHDSASVKAKGDRLWVKQILSNLISNAIKYSLPNATTTVSLSADPSSKMAYIKVQDEGLGFNEEDLRNIFKKYKKLSATPTNNESSTGLGLYIPKTLVEKMGGTIEVRSAGLGKGSTFILSLPLHD